MKETLHTSPDKDEEQNEEKTVWVPSAVQTDPEHVELKADVPETKDFNVGP